jgi:lysophospholipase L1-like esterase
MKKYAFIIVLALFAFSPPTINIAAWGDSLTEGDGYVPYPTWLEQMSGNSVFNGGVGGETSQQIKLRFDADVAKHSWPTIIWAGGNNIWQPSQVKADIAGMRASLEHNRFLIVGIFRHMFHSQTELNNIAQINNDLAATYGSRYVDVQSYLISKYDPNNPQDVIDKQNNTTPSSFRADHIHLNSRGNELVAEKLNTYMNILNGTSTGLPVKLKSFTVKKNLLQWITLDETNVSHTEIERSPDGLLFTSIGKVSNVKKPSSYTFLDTHPINGNAFYRLKFVDHDGLYEYSSIRAIVNVSGFKVNLVSNPVQQQLRLRITSDKKANVTLIVISSDGREVQRRNFNVSKGTEIKSFGFPSLSKGTYYARLVIPEGQISILRFLTQTSSPGL